MYVRTSFLRLSNSPLYVYTCRFVHPSIHSSTDGVASLLATVNDAAVNMGVQIPVRSTFISCGFIPSRITGAHAGNSLPTLWKNHRCLQQLCQDPSFSTPSPTLTVPVFVFCL